MQTTDPFDWGIEEVITELVKTTDGVMTGMVQESFRYNEITGKILLTAITFENLKADLQIGPLGRRGKVIEQVERLRRESQKYRRYTQEQDGLVVEERTITELNLPQPSAFLPGQLQERDTAGAEHLMALDSPVREPLNPDPEGHYVLYENPQAPPLLVSLSGSPAPGLHRTSEPPQVEDGGVDAVQEPAQHSSSPPINREESSSTIRPLSQSPQRALTLTADKPAVAESARQPVTREKKYLGPYKLLVDDLFYKGRNSGQKSDSEDDEFLILKSPHAPGIRRYVAAQMRHYLSNVEVVHTIRDAAPHLSVRKDPHLRAAVKPYKASLVIKHYKQSITVFDARGDTCDVSHSTVDDLDLPWGSRQTKSQTDSRMVIFGENPLAKKYNYNQNDTSLHDWDFLLKWTKVDNDKELPAFLDSGSEGEYDLETFREIEEEEFERSRSPDLAIRKRTASPIANKAKGKDISNRSREKGSPGESIQGGDDIGKGLADEDSRNMQQAVDVIMKDGEPSADIDHPSVDGLDDFSDIDAPKVVNEIKKPVRSGRPTNLQEAIDIIDLTMEDSPDPVEMDLDADGDDESESTKRRKRRATTIVEDATAKATRATTHRFVKARQQRIKADEERRKRQGIDLGIVINKGKYAKDNDIFFHPEIAAQLKPHQVEGIQFIWKELVQSGRNMGALLAHTMGLGKTFQVIAFLHTLAVAGASPDPKTYNQIPQHLRKSKTLIICPPTLIENWWDEFHNFLPLDPNTKELDLRHTGKIYKVRSANHVAKIKEWNKNGGIIIMGYQRLLMYIKDGGELKDILLQKPQIIVADEAHQLKNASASITRAAAQFKSTSRIAITGSPLSNYLSEYWAMIEWIDPGYLGPAKEFEEKYAKPISDGLHIDSTVGERRQALKLLRVLKTDLDPKVHRVDITALSQLLPPKREFLITLPLTPLQKEMYLLLIEFIKKGEFGFLDATHLLSVVNNHPKVLLSTLEGRSKKEDKRVGVVDPLDPLAADSPIEVTKPALDAALELIEKHGDPKKILSRRHSYRMDALRLILTYSKQVNDKVLVFTHSIPTLNLLEHYLRAWKFNYKKLDGQTQMAKRQQSTKDFNSAEGGNDLYLISTRAGGQGLNLFGANRVVIFDFRWCPMWEEQAIGRAYRIGQEKPVFVYRFIAGGTFEDKVRNMTDFKQQLATRVVDKKNPMRSSSKLGKLLLKPPEDIEKDNLKDFIGKDPHVLDKLLEETEYVYRIKSTETFVPDDEEEEKLTEEEKRQADEMLEDLKRLRTTDAGIATNSASTTGDTSKGTPQVARQQHIPSSSVSKNISRNPFTYDVNDVNTSDEEEDVPVQLKPVPAVTIPSRSTVSMPQPTASKPLKAHTTTNNTSSATTASASTTTGLIPKSVPSTPNRLLRKTLPDMSTSAPKRPKPSFASPSAVSSSSTMPPNQSTAPTKTSATSSGSIISPTSSNFARIPATFEYTSPPPESPFSLHRKQRTPFERVDSWRRETGKDLVVNYRHRLKGITKK